jgi:hypothetical protein
MDGNRNSSQIRTENGKSELFNRASITLSLGAYGLAKSLAYPNGEERG